MDERNELAAWIAPEIDFEELFQEKQYDKLICLAEENINLVRKLSVGSSADDLLRSVNLGISIIDLIYAENLFIIVSFRKVERKAGNS